MDNLGLGGRVRGKGDEEEGILEEGMGIRGNQGEGGGFIKKNLAEGPSPIRLKFSDRVQDFWLSLLVFVISRIELYSEELLASLSIDIIFEASHTKKPIWILGLKTLSEEISSLVSPMYS